jgi:hypothetical protein
MNISGRSFGEHIRLLTPLFGLIAAIWVLRWSLFHLGLPLSVVRYLSVTAILPVCILLAAVLIHVKRFGGYSNVVLSAFLLVMWSQALIVAAILFAVLTGIDNVYTLPEFSALGPDPNHTRHIRGQLTFGIGFESLSGALIGCLFLFILRRIAPSRTV